MTSHFIHLKNKNQDITQSNTNTNEGSLVVDIDAQPQSLTSEPPWRGTGDQMDVPANKDPEGTRYYNKIQIKDLETYIAKLELACICTDVAFSLYFSPGSDWTKGPLWPTGPFGKLKACQKWLEI